MPNRSEVDAELQDSPSAKQRVRAAEEMAARVQRAMVESSLAQSGAYGSKKQRSTMDELYMDLKGLQLARSDELQAHSSSSPFQQPQDMQGFNWEKAHHEWEQAQRVLHAKTAASRSAGTAGPRQGPAIASTSSNTSSTQPRTGLPPAGAKDRGRTTQQHGPAQFQGHPSPVHAPPHASAHVFVPLQEQPQAGSTATTKVASPLSGEEPSAPKGEEQGEAEEQQQPSSSSRWGEKTKAVLMKMHIGKFSKRLTQQEQQQQEGEGEVEHHPLQDHDLSPSGEEADLLPHHRVALAARQQQAPNTLLARSTSATSSFQGKEVATHAGGQARKGLSSSLALPTMGSEQGGVLGKGSFKTALAMLLGTEDKH